MYVEVTEAVNKGRGVILPAGQITREPRPHEYYISLFPFDKSILRQIEDTGSTSDFKGKQYCNYIAFDIDNEDNVERSREDALQLLNYWQDIYELRPDDVYIYFSGSKGFHLILYRAIFGELEPCHNIHLNIKKAAIELANGIKIDTSIYNSTRLFRVENSINAKSGLYKIRLTYDELFSLSMDEIREMAKQPRELPGHKSIINEPIRRIVEAAFLQTEEKKEIGQGFFAPPEAGDRNNKLYKQACTLFQTSDLHEKSIYEIIRSINLASPAPLDDREIDTIVRSARTKKKGKESDEPIMLKLFGELWDEWVDSLRKETKKIKLVFKELDDEFQGKCRSHFGVVLGYGGSKKSMYGQNLCYKNITEGLRCVYSNMEMGNATLTERFINIAATGYENKMASDFAAEAFEAGGSLDKIKSDMESILNNNLIVCENSNMTSKKYDAMIEKIHKEHGPVDLLIVDGMSMMGGSGTEVERASEHSKDLKELAKKWNILVVAIVHASKGAELDTRDLTRKARASEKIIDNCDWVMTLSLIRGDKGYYQDNGIYHMWNKRGTGRTIEKIWEFKDAQLMMQESAKDISQIQTIEL